MERSSVSKVGNRRQNAEERNEVEVSGNNDISQAEQNANQEEQLTDLHSKHDQNTNPLGLVNTQQTQEACVLLDK